MVKPTHKNPEEEQRFFLKGGGTIIRSEPGKKKTL